MIKILDGSKRAQEIKDEVKRIIEEQHAHPSLGIVLVGNDPASKLYVSLKEKACKEVGIDFNTYFLDENTPQEKVHEVIDFLNNDDTINGILLQLPLPKGLDEDQAIAKIDPKKDVDGFTKSNIDAYRSGNYSLEPGLVAGIKDLILSSGENIEGKSALIIANSDIFADPLISMFKQFQVNAEFIRPDDNILKSKTTIADIIVIAVGRKWFLTSEMVKPGSIIIDVGTNKVDNVTYGDVNPEVDEVAGYRSPVPGGVGPMTVAMLLRNTLQLFLQQHEI